MFSFIKKLLPGSKSPQPQTVSPFVNMREAGQHVSAHLDALAELVSLELREYSRRQSRRAALAAAAVVPAVAAWLFLCAWLAWGLQLLWGWGWALAAVTLVNVLLAAGALTAAALYRVGEFAPLTRHELNNDWQCLKLLINADKKS